MKKKYALYPGYLTSRRDRQEHFISATILAQLYDVPMSECVTIFTAKDMDSDKGYGLIPLYPAYDENYILPIWALTDL